MWMCLEVVALVWLVVCCVVFKVTFPPWGVCGCLGGMWCWQRWM